MATYLLVRTAFHGGGVLSRHRTAATADSAVARYRQQTDCACGCVGVVSSDEYDALPEAHEPEIGPYRLASRRAVGRPITLDRARKGQVVLDAQSWETARKLGDGNASAGIRKALADHA